MINFYWSFIAAAAKIIQPLNNLLKSAKNGNAPIECSKQTENSFRESKYAFADATMLVSRSEHKKSRNWQISGDILPSQFERFTNKVKNWTLDMVVKFIVRIQQSNDS